MQVLWGLHLKRANRKTICVLLVEKLGFESLLLVRAKATARGVTMSSSDLAKQPDSPMSSKAKRENAMSSEVDVVGQENGLGNTSGRCLQIHEVRPDRVTRLPLHAFSLSLPNLVPL